MSMIGWSLQLCGFHFKEEKKNHSNVIISWMGLKGTYQICAICSFMGRQIEASIENSQFAVNGVNKRNNVGIGEK